MRSKARDLTDLPYAEYLEDFAEDLTAEGDYNTIRFHDSEFTDVAAGNARFIESAFSAVRFTQADGSGARAPMPTT
jgi:hypothetical protein